MKKVLIGVGVGCGVLILLVIAAVVAGGFWVKSKVGNAVAASQEIEKQEQALQDLDSKYPFEPPADGQPIELEEKRVEEYLAIRTSLLPAFKSFEAKVKDLEARTQDPKQSLSAGLEMVGMTSEMLRQVRATYLEQLDAHRMSPTEFHGITAAIYSSSIGKGMAEMREAQRETLESAIAELEEQSKDPALDDAQRSALAEQLAAMKEQLAKLPPKGAPPSEDLATHKANAALLEKYKAQIEKEANPGLDFLLLGEGDALQKAFKPMEKLGEQ